MHLAMEGPVSLDLVGALVLTLISAIAIGVPALWYARTRGGQVLLTAHILWFVAVVAFAASGSLNWRLDLGAPVLGLAIVVPMLVLVFLATAAPPTRAALAAIPVPALIAIHAIRVLGFLFLLLFAAGRIAAPFAPEAGWGDVIAGATAVPVAWALASRGAGVRWLVLVWNSFGLLDFLAASSLGMMSAPGSPLQAFFDAPGSTAMTALPWAIIPVFLVPQLLVGHLAIYWRLSRTTEEFVSNGLGMNVHRRA
jgi:hypothetical protein